MSALHEVECDVCGATQWPTADCMACGHPLPRQDDGDVGHDR
jgi:hypothetical protein